MSAPAPTWAQSSGSRNASICSGAMYGSVPPCKRGLGVVGRMRRLGQVEIEQLRPVIDRQQDVGGLDVAVKDLLSVGIVQGAGQHHHDPGHALRVRAADGKALPAVAAREGLHALAGISSEPATYFPLEAVNEHAPERERPAGRPRGFDALDDFVQGQPG